MASQPRVNLAAKENLFISIALEIVRDGFPKAFKHRCYLCFTDSQLSGDTISVV